jgi:hypothetical protein
MLAECPKISTKEITWSKNERMVLNIESIPVTGREGQ